MWLLYSVFYAFVIFCGTFYGFCRLAASKARIKKYIFKKNVLAMTTKPIHFAFFVSDLMILSNHNFLVQSNPQCIHRTYTVHGIVSFFSSILNRFTKKPPRNCFSFIQVFWTNYCRWLGVLLQYTIFISIFFIFSLCSPDKNHTILDHIAVDLCVFCRAAILFWLQAVPVVLMLDALIQLHFKIFCSRRSVRLVSVDESWLNRAIEKKN